MTPSQRILDQATEWQKKREDYVSFHDIYCPCVACVAQREKEAESR